MEDGPGAPVHARRDRLPLRARLRELGSVDLRSLAVHRIGLAVLVLLELVSLAGVWPVLFVPDGALPLDVAARITPPEALVWLQPFVLGGAAFAWLLPPVLGALAVGLALGLRTRLCCLGCWLLLSCLQVRAPAVVDYGDVLLRLLLLWSCFTPLGARWSLDARGRAAAQDTPQRVLSAGTVALLLQFASVYLVAGSAKTGPDWQEGLTAVELVLRQQYWATPLSPLLLGVPGLAAWITRITPLFEIALALLLFAPVATRGARVVAVLGVWAFHVGLAAFITLGVFPLVCMIGALVFLPGAVWSRLAAVLARLGSGAGTRGRARAAPEPAPGDAAVVAVGGSRLASGVVGVLAGLVLLANLAAAAGRGTALPAPLRALAGLLRLEQRWDMYAPDGPHWDGWIVVPGRLADGRRVDLARGGASLRDGPPAAPPWAGPDYRWGMYLDNVRRHPDPLGLAHARWLCREWSGPERPDRLLSLALDHMYVPNRLGAHRPQARRRRILRHRCVPGAPEP